MDNTEYNRILTDAAKSAMQIDALSEEDLIKELSKNELVQGTFSEKESRVLPETAKSLYIQGTLLVSDKGCPQTAAYMIHAMDFSGTNSPSTMYHKGDSWAIGAVFNDEFQGVVTQKFENEILSQGKANGVVTGSFAYTTANSVLDYYTALHNVNYSVTFTKQTNGYSVNYKITDIYDFAWGKYDSFAIGFGNNYCVAMQTLGLIKPFKIEITYKQ